MKVCQKRQRLGGKWDFTWPQGHCETLFPAICCFVSEILLEASQKRITSENYFGNKTKNKKPKTNIFPQTDFLLDSNHTWQQFQKMHMLNSLKMLKGTEWTMKGKQEGAALQEATCLFRCVSLSDSSSSGQTLGGEYTIGYIDDVL